MEIDVVIIGGAFAGASTGLLLKRRNPAWRVVIVEKAQAFDRKVGESTTEVSSRYMTAVLGLTSHLGHHQLNKQGLRIWFDDGEGDLPFERCGEVGARFNSRLSGFQIDRAVLDEELLSMAVKAGCELRRPAKLVDLNLGGEGCNRLTIESGGERETLLCRWVVDASGRAAVIARKQGLLAPLEAHPVNAIWGRFQGVRDWDGYEIKSRHPAYAQACHTGRQWATNHLTGYGWWCWIIPLKGGDTSIGLVYDRRLYTPPEGANLAERLKAHWMQSPVGREMLGCATPIAGDMRAYSQLPYSVSQIAGSGWVLVGDAAGFLDPLYSPGLDFCSYTSHHAQTLIATALEGGAPAIAKLNESFERCFRFWFEGIYHDKYHYLGDAELMTIAFLIDISSYHFGPVRDVLKSNSSFSIFPFAGKQGRIAGSILAFFNRRLVALGKKKRRAGLFGNRNTDHRTIIGGFVPNGVAVRMFLQGVCRWLLAEWRGLWIRKRDDAA